VELTLRAYRLCMAMKDGLKKKEHCATKFYTSIILLLYFSIPHILCAYISVPLNIALSSDYIVSGLQENLPRSIFQELPT
jgi:hypothetical protein